MALIGRLVSLHGSVFSGIEHVLDGWFLQLGARFAFASVLFLYYWNSAMTKIGDGIFGFLSLKVGAFAQILPTVAAEHSYNISKIPFFPYHLIVYAGTYAEIVLPLLIVVGLFTRLAALGMIGFIVAQTYVDIQFHNVDEKTVGAMFDRIPDAMISDQRLLWSFVLLVLVVKGGGFLSLDKLLGGRFARAE